MWILAHTFWLPKVKIPLNKEIKPNQTVLLGLRLDFVYVFETNSNDYLDYKKGKYPEFHTEWEYACYF